MPYKLYNPDPIDYKISVYGVSVKIPAKGYVVITSLVVPQGNIRDYMPQIEIQEVSDEEYQKFREESAKREKELEKESKEKVKKEAEELELEAEKTEAKIKAREKAAEKKRKKDLEVKLGSVHEEEKLKKQVDETVVVNTAYAPVSKVATTPKKRGRKPKV